MAVMTVADDGGTRVESALSADPPPLGVMSTIKVTVVERLYVAQDTLSLTLVAEDGAALPPFEAGAHVDLHLPNGLVRQYSLCNDPHERHRYRIAVLKEQPGRGGSRCVHENLQVGDVVRIGRPRNLFGLDEAEDYLLLAGGIGVTPLMAMAHSLQRSGRRFALHHWVRSRERAAFSADILGLWPTRAHVHCDDAPAGRFPVELACSQRTVTAGTSVFVCGPEGFIQHVSMVAARAGVEPRRLHFERFSGPALIPSEPALSERTASEDGVRCGPAGAAADCEFEVELASSGVVVPVRSGQTVVDALKAGGIAVPVSCEQGICGTCTMRLLAGEPEHRDMCLSEEERSANSRFVPCCSRAISGRLVVDHL